MSSQFTFWTPTYEQRIIDRVRSATACAGLANTKIIELLWLCHEKWQFYPDGIKHHGPKDEPMDDWFISRITELINRGPECRKVN